MKRTVTVRLGQGVAVQAAEPGQTIVNHFGSGQQNNDFSSFFSEAPGSAQNVVMQNGRIWVDGIELPPHVSISGTRVLHRGREVTRDDKDLIRRHPNILTLLDRYAPEKKKKKKKKRKVHRHACRKCRESEVASVALPCRCAALCAECADKHADRQHCPGCDKPYESLQKLAFTADA